MAKGITLAHAFLLKTGPSALTLRQHGVNSNKKFRRIYNIYLFIFGTNKGIIPLVLQEEIPGLTRPGPAMSEQKERKKGKRTKQLPSRANIYTGGSTVLFKLI